MLVETISAPARKYRRDGCRARHRLASATASRCCRVTSRCQSSKRALRNPLRQSLSCLKHRTHAAVEQQDAFGCADFGGEEGKWPHATDCNLLKSRSLPSIAGRRAEQMADRRKTRSAQFMVAKWKSVNAAIDEVEAPVQRLRPQRPACGLQ